MRKHLRLLALLAVIGLVMTACGDGGETTTTIDTPPATDAPTTTGAPTTESMATTTTGAATTTTGGAGGGEEVLACQVTDTGGIDDNSFNQTAYAGVEMAVADGVASADSSFLESTSPADYAPNIDAFLGQDCDLIITVGFLLGDATAAAAAANPDQPFEILDFAYDPPIPNVVGAVFATADAAFLAGYLAAGTTQTGVIATYGGIQLPGAVTDFMDGFVWGARYYNTQNGTDVQVLGWNPEDQTGTFTGNFESLDDGRNTTQAFLDEGADIILPVAGPVGEGSLALAQEVGDVWVVGVDADWTLTFPQYADVVLTSVLKGLDVAVYDVIQSVSDGTFEGGTRVFTIADEGVGIGTIAGSVDPALVTQVEEVRAALVDGSLVASEAGAG